MSTTADSFYVTGGTLRQDALSYVERRADTELFEGLQQGQYCYVLTARQMGKSSLMVRTAARLREAGAAVVILDLTAIGQNVSPEQWYGGLLDHLGRELDQEEPLEEYWQAHERVGPLQRWIGALEAVVLKKAGERREARGESDDMRTPPTEPPASRLSPLAARLVIFIDEIDAVRSLPFSTDELFAAIRECYNGRTKHPEFERLTFCLLGVASPSDLIRDTRTTPFNIGRRIELTDFTAAEAVPLAWGLGRTPPPAPPLPGEGGLSPHLDRNATACSAAWRLLERVLYWTGGHPYLTQRLCQAVAEGGGSRLTALGEERGRRAGGTPALPGEVDRQCEALFLSASAREKDDNLLFVRERLLRSEADRASLLDLYAQVWGGKQVGVDDTNPLIDLLRLSGIARVEGGRLQVRNRIYQRVFDRIWVTTHMPDAELRRQRAAYRRGLLRATAVAAVVLAVVAGLAVTALGQAQRARAAEARQRVEAQQTRRLLYVANLNLAQQDWETSNISRLRQLLEETKASPERGFEWFYWQRLCHLDLRTLWPHTEGLGPLDFSPDGTRFVTGGPEATARVWNAGTGRQALTLQGHSPSPPLVPRSGRVPGWINAVAFSPEGRRILTGSADRTARIWDAITGRERVVLLGHTSPITAATFSPDGERVLTGSDDRTARLWDAGTGRPILTLTDHPDAVSRVAFSPGGRRILTRTRWEHRPATGWWTPVRVWDTASGRKLLALGRVNLILFSPDGRLIMTTEASQKLTVWDAATGRTIVARQEQTESISVVAFSPNSRRIVVGNHEGTARILESRTGRQVATLRGHKLWFHVAAFSPDGARILTSNHDGTAKIWNARTGRLLLHLTGPTLPVQVAAFSPDGRRVLTAGEDHNAKIWDSTTGREILTFRHTDTISHATFAPDGRRIVTRAGDAAKVWDATGDREALTLRCHGKDILATAFSPDGRRVLTGSADKTAKLWDARTGRELHTLRGHPDPIYAAAFSPQGQRIATGGWAGIVKIWDAGTGREIRTLRGHTAPVRSISFSPDGRQILSSTWADEGTARIWDVATGRPILVITAPLAVAPGERAGRKEKSIWSAVFSPDGRRIVASSTEGGATVWDATTGRRLLAVRGHRSYVTDTAYSPDGRTFATSCADRTAKLWDAATGREIVTLKGHNLGLLCVTFSPDGRRVATGSWDATARLWNPVTGRETLTLKGHTDTVNAVAFSRDGRRIVTGSSDGTAKVWDTAIPQQVVAWEAEEHTARDRLAAHMAAQ
jgi:WD40 repeat protein